MIRNTLPSSLISAKLSQNVADLREQLKNTSQEAVTGRRADLTQHLSGRIGSAMLSQKALNDVASQAGLLQLRESRLDIAQQGLTRVATSVSGLSARMQSSIGAGNDQEQAAVASDAGIALDSVLSALNVRHGERYVFSGDATSTTPFAGSEQLLADIRGIASTATDAADFEAQIDTYFNSPTGGWQQGIFGGTASTSDPDGVTAVDPAITQLVSGLAVMAISEKGGSLPNGDARTAILDAASIRLASGETSVTNLRADLGVKQKRISDEQASLAIEKTVLTEAFNQMAGRDQYEAASELQQLESNLEASYLLTARLANLSLLNFLR